MMFQAEPFLKELLQKDFSDGKPRTPGFPLFASGDESDRLKTNAERAGGYSIHGRKQSRGLDLLGMVSQSPGPLSGMPTSLNHRERNFSEFCMPLLKSSGGFLENKPTQTLVSTGDANGGFRESGFDKKRNLTFELSPDVGQPH